MGARVSMCGKHMTTTTELYSQNACSDSVYRMILAGRDFFKLLFFTGKLGLGREVGWKNMGDPPIACIYEIHFVLNFLKLLGLYTSELFIECFDVHVYASALSSLRVLRRSGLRL